MTQPATTPRRRRPPTPPRRRRRSTLLSPTEGTSRSRVDRRSKLDHRHARAGLTAERGVFDDGPARRGDGVLRSVVVFARLRDDDDDYDNGVNAAGHVDDYGHGTAGSLVRTTTFSLTVTAAPDTTAPAVALGASPANGSTVRATVTLSATASDNVGVVGVQFLLDGVNLGAEDTTSPYSISWNTTTATNAPHVLSARARDAAGNTTLATVVNVTVDNQAQAGTIVINGGAAATNSRTATLTLAATDNSGAVSQSGSRIRGAASRRPKRTRPPRPGP